MGLIGAGMLTGDQVNDSLRRVCSDKGDPAMCKLLVSILAAAAAVVSLSSAQAQQQIGTETPQDVLAAQIRLQGFACDKAVGATRDVKRSKPDFDVWVLKCSNATYRVSRAPDMAAKIEPLR